MSEVRTLTVPLSTIQYTKVASLVQSSEGTVTGSDIYLFTNKGNCKVDVFGRVTWLADGVIR